MVSFNCTRCQDVVKKPKVVSHAASCGVSTFSCVDCMKHFDLDSIKNHTSCVSEVQKYQGKWKGPITKTYGPDSDDEDEEMKKKHEATKELHQQRRRPRQMNFNDSSDDDDSDNKNKKSDKKSSVAAVPTTASSAKKQNKHDDDDDDDEHETAGPKAPKNSAKQQKSKSPARGASTSAVKASPKLAPTTANANANVNAVVCSFNVASSEHEFNKFVSSILSEYEAGVSLKTAAKLVADKIVAGHAKEIRTAVQNLVAEHCKVTKDGHVVVA